MTPSPSDTAQTSFPTADIADLTCASLIRRVARDLSKADAIDWLERHAAREDLGPMARKAARSLFLDMTNGE